MPNCRRAAEHLAEAFFTCDDIKAWAALPEEQRKPPPVAKEMLTNLEGYLEGSFKELSHEPFENYHHDIANLRGQFDSEYPSPYFINRYAEDLQKQIISQGFLDLIDCQCKR